MTVSLQSQQHILFSERIAALGAGMFSGKFTMELAPGALPLLNLFLVLAVSPL